LVDFDYIKSNELHREGDMATLGPEERRFYELGRVMGDIKEIVVHIDG